MIGTVFDDRYEIKRRLGSGGMAEVYLAYDRHLGRQVALKVLLSKYANDEQFIERFRREASSAAGLNHPNIVQIYDRGEAEGTYYIAMEYLDGRTLKDLIVEHGPLRTDHIVSIAGQILEGLRFAERKGVVHRDIKPQNIMVDAEGRVKVTDFGIARAANSVGMTETGSILGTAHYLSPEQAQGHPAEAGADLYSLGVVMYEMATGRLPFTGDNPVAIAMQHVHEPPVLPSTLVPGIPENLERVILKALAKTPETRYRSADEFLDDLRRVERGLVVAPPPGLGEQEQPTRVMGPADVGATSVLQRTQVRPAGAGVAPLPPVVPPIEEPRRSRWWLWLLALLFLALLAGAAYAIFAPSSPPPSPTLVTVPPVLGLDETAARNQLEAAGFTMQVAGTEPSTQYAAGQVTKQQPDAGTQLAEGETVTVTLAAAQEQVDVPSVVGKTQQEAGTALGLAGFTVKPQTEQSDKPKGEVVRQDPAAGQQAPRGSEVIIYVSTGPAQPTTVPVPDVVGVQRDKAKATLEAAGFVVSIQSVSSDQPAGEVVEQSPSAGTLRAPNSTVLLSVSSGPQTVAVPNVIGMKVNQARNALRQAGLLADEVEQPDAGAPAGTVLDQDPPPDTPVKPGSTVKLLVAAPVTPTTTPSTTAPPAT